MALLTKPQKLVLRILLMEDDAIDARLVSVFSDSFQRYRPRITHVRDTKSAADAIEKQFFDILFLDFWLNGQSSLKFLTDLERREIRVPTIILSNITPNHVESLRLTTGGAIFVNKGGCTAKGLETAVEEAFALARAAHSNAASMQPAKAFRLPA